jgi:hypothetical protein
MVGTWQSLQNQPSFYADTMLLLTDGTVMCHELSTNRWYNLTPDGNGNYVRGTWSQLQSMADNGSIATTQGGPSYAPLYFASAVLKDGRVLVTGGEDNGQTSSVDLLAVEMYDPLKDSWSILPNPPGWTRIGDAQSCVLPDGRVIIGSLDSNTTAIYDPVVGSWSAAGAKNNINSNEETWTLLPDQTVLTVDCNGHPQTERYLISNNRWIRCGSTPVDLVEAISIEIGPAILLPDRRVFAIGATNATALYTMPIDPNQPGTWASGPSFPAQEPDQVLGAKDTPACLLPNGKVLCVVGPVDGVSDHYLSPSYFFEFDPEASNLVAIPNPTNNGREPYNGRLLLVPTGQVFFANNTNSIQVYTPDGQPKAEWKPTISRYPPIMIRGYTYAITGTQFNGISQACSYGDDAQMATNYPLVRLTNVTAEAVRFLRTFNHSTMGVATGSTQQSTNVLIEQGIQVGQWNMAVIANGIASDPVTINIPAPDLWIKFLYVDLLSRNPSQTEINDWANYMNQGASYSSVCDDFLYSLEYCKDTVTTLYNKLLDRTPDVGGLSNWINYLQQQRRSIQDAIVGFCNSIEYMQKHPVPTQFVESLYNKLLGRASDPAGLTGWVGSLNSGKNTTATVITGFLRSEEYALQRATECYTKYLGRDPDPTGLQGWMRVLENGLSLQDLSKGFVTSEEYILRCQNR